MGVHSVSSLQIKDNIRKSIQFCQIPIYCTEVWKINVPFQSVVIYIYQNSMWTDPFLQTIIALYFYVFYYFLKVHNCGFFSPLFSFVSQLPFLQL